MKKVLIQRTKELLLDAFYVFLIMGVGLSIAMFFFLFVISLGVLIF